MPSYPTQLVHISAIVFYLAVFSGRSEHVDDRCEVAPEPFPALLQVASKSSAFSATETSVDGAYVGSFEGWIRHGTKKNLFAMHIPKTAGISFALDLLRLFPNEVGIYSHEKTYLQMSNLKGPTGHIVTLLRQPRSHVLSQFYECKSDPVWHPTPHKLDHFYNNFSTWLQTFDGGKNKEDLNCYHPLDMQTRCFSMSESQAMGCHHLPASWNLMSAQQQHKARVHQLTLAVENMERCFFVGLLERYQESVCLLYGKLFVGRPLPKFCNCDDRAAWNSFQLWHSEESHSVKHHSISEVVPNDMRLVDDLITNDVILYKIATERFNREIRKLERSSGVRISCSEANI
jgi:hypothetical protein